MLSITIITVGKLKEKWLIDGVNEYSKRLSAYCKFEIIEISEQRLAQKPSQAEIAATLIKEGEEIIKKIPPRAKAIALCIEGEQLSSPGLAALFDQYQKEASQLVLIVGSSHGLSDRVKAAACFRLSISPMTFPHQLARLILCEQVYRAMSIAGGSKYHK